MSLIGQPASQSSHWPGVYDTRHSSLSLCTYTDSARCSDHGYSTPEVKTGRPLRRLKTNRYGWETLTFGKMKMEKVKRVHIDRSLIDHKKSKNAIKNTNSTVLESHKIPLSPIKISFDSEKIENSTTVLRLRYFSGFHVLGHHRCRPQGHSRWKISEIPTGKWFSSI